MADYFLTRFKSQGNIPKNMGSLSAVGTTQWYPVTHVPNGFYAQLSGTSGTISATCHFEFSDDGATLAASEGTTLALSGTGVGIGTIVAGAAGTTMNPLVPWKWVRLNVTVISGTGTNVTANQVLGN